MSVLTEKYRQMKKNYFTFGQPLVWPNVILLVVVHVLAIYAIFFVIPFSQFLTTIWCIFLVNLSGLSITAGAHRLWTHKAYKARLPLKIFLMFTHIVSGQYCIEQWVRDHRTHHKYTDTNADPHNIQRGFFYSHCGWLIMKRHPELLEKGKLVDISDMKEDPVVRFQKKYYVPLLLTFFVIMPSAVPMLFWGETLFNAVLEGLFFRYAFQLNSVWLVNSVAHLYGSKPYDKKIMAVQSTFVAFFAVGEGWHNFHHVFPWDYRIGEAGQGLQFGALFIKICASLGLAYDLKVASPEMIAKVVTKQRMQDIEEVPPPDDIRDNNVKND